jgi:hypothetical protein
MNPRSALNLFICAAFSRTFRDKICVWCSDLHRRAWVLIARIGKSAVAKGGAGYAPFRHRGQTQSIPCDMVVTLILFLK